LNLDLFAQYQDFKVKHSHNIPTETDFPFLMIKMICMSTP